MTDYTSRYLDSCTCCMSFNPPNVSLHCYTTCLFSVLFHGKTTEDSDVKEVDVLVDPCSIVNYYFLPLLNSHVMLGDVQLSITNRDAPFIHIMGRPHPRAAGRL